MKKDDLTINRILEFERIKTGVYVSKWSMYQIARDNSLDVPFWTVTKNDKKLFSTEHWENNTLFDAVVKLARRLLVEENPIIKTYDDYEFVNDTSTYSYDYVKGKITYSTSITCYDL